MRTAHLFNRLDESINSFQHVFNMARIACDRLQLGTEYIVEFFNDLRTHDKQTSTVSEKKKQQYLLRNY